MAEMLTAKEIQDLLQVDRSTIYRMAEAGRIPAIKVGKQWRFPAGQINGWLQLGSKMPQTSYLPETLAGGRADDLASIIPLDCVQLIQDSFSDLLGVMLVVTDMSGRPITQPSNPCGLFQAISTVPKALQRCIQSWHQLAERIDLEPRFSESHLKLKCTRALIRDGVEPELLQGRLNEVYVLDGDQQQKVLAHIQQIANIVAHIVCERKTLIGRLDAIADLTSI